MAANKPVVPPVGDLWLADLTGLVLTLTPGVVAWGMTILFLRAMWESSFLFLVIFLAPFISCLVFIATIFSLRCLLPRVEPGEYKLGLNWGTLAWHCNQAMARASAVSGLLPLLQSFYVLKFLYWRALGAKIAFQVTTSPGVEFSDFPLISIASGCTFGDGSEIVCHALVGDKLVLAPVKVGRNVSVGAGTTLFLGTTLGQEVNIGFGNRVHGDQVAAGTKIDNYEWESGSPKLSLPTPSPRAHLQNTGSEIFEQV